MMPVDLASSTQAGTPPDRDSQSFRLLVVDDDLATIRQLGRLLSGFAQVSFATSGEDALALARTQRPDLILLDAELPGMSGFEVFRALRNSPETARVPVVFATSHTEPEVEAAALGMGAADFISKPLVPSQVLARVRRQLRQGPQPLLPAGHAERVPRVLIVDDDPAMIQLLQTLLAEVGDCYFALDSARALDMAATVKPDLVLLDIDLPGVDGIELCRQARADPRCAGMAIAFVTQHAQAENETLCFDSGADDFIGKPFDRGVLLARVRRLIDSKRRADAALEAMRVHWQGLGDARVAEVVGAASDAIVVADADGRIVLANRAASRMFGAAPGEPIGQGLQRFLPDVPPEAPFAGRQPVQRCDGSMLSAELTLSASGSSQERLRIAVLRDTTERDRAEVVARRQAETEASHRATATMLGFIAHEMGNSLNAILGSTELLLHDTRSPPSPAHAQRLQRIAQSADQLQALMRDVIDLNRLGAGKFRIELSEFDPGQAIHAACTELSGQIETARVQMRHDLPAEPLCLRADPRRLQQCLVNLISNAIKYGQPAGRIDIALRREDAQVVIEVRDAGPGLTQAQIAQLFEPFNRLGQDIGLTPGSGLGLLVTRELANAMGGRIEVDSVVGAGSCFTLYFPAGARSERAPTAQQA